MRAALRATVEAIEPCDEVERDHQADVLNWIDSGQPLHRITKPATPPKHLVSYALLIDPIACSALLIDHRLAGLWLPTGGHVEPDEEPWGAAQRELAEELGVVGTFAPPLDPAPFFLTVTGTVGTTARHVDVSLWYAFVGSSAADIQADEREALGTSWWSFDDINHSPESRFDPHLPRAISKLSAALADRS